MSQRKRFDWPAMQALIDSGNGYLHCHRVFGIAHATWMKAIARGDIRLESSRADGANCRKRYDWSAIQEYHDAGHSVRACQRRFGFALHAWHKARLAGRIRSRGVIRLSIEQLAAKRSNRGIIKRRLIASGALLNKCTICGITDWQGRPLSLQIDHINGERLDYRLENLRILCPNCHSQTETFAGRNLVARRRNPG